METGQSVLCCEKDRVSVVGCCFGGFFACFPCMLGWWWLRLLVFRIFLNSQIGLDFCGVRLLSF